MSVFLIKDGAVLVVKSCRFFCCQSSHAQFFLSSFSFADNVFEILNVCPFCDEDK